MAVDTIARALAASILGSDGKILQDKLPSFFNGELTGYNVGGIPIGISLDGKTWEEIFTMMLFGVINPQFTEPTFFVSHDVDGSEIGSKVTISGSMVFNRGTINPPFGTSGYRSGLPSAYEYNDGTVIETSSLSVPYSFETGYLHAGENVFTFKVTYGEGEQPKDSAGRDYDSPYPAGDMEVSVVIMGLDPVYQSSTGAEHLFEDPICVTYFSNDTIGTGFEFDLNGEQAGQGKQVVAISKGVDIIGIQQYDEVNQRWAWIFGSKESSFEAFDIGEKEIDVGEGQIKEYYLYENALDQLGRRQLRFIIAEP